MPMISIPIKAREWIMKHAGEDRHVSNDPKCFGLLDLHEAKEAGFFAALQCLLPSAVVGMLCMDADEAREGRPSFTERFPGLIVLGDPTSHEKRVDVLAGEEMDDGPAV